jgi:hypothetical protein
MRVTFVLLFTFLFSKSFCQLNAYFTRSGIGGFYQAVNDKVVTCPNSEVLVYIQRACNSPTFQYDSVTFNFTTGTVSIVSIDPQSNYLGGSWYKVVFDVNDIGDTISVIRYCNGNAQTDALIIYALGSDNQISITGNVNDLDHLCYTDEIFLNIQKQINFQPQGIGWWTFSGDYLGSSDSISLIASDLGAGYQGIYLMTGYLYPLNQFGDNLTCTILSDSIKFDISSPILQDICIVTVDTSVNKNLIVWEKQNSLVVKGYIIYKRNDLTSNYDSIGFVAKDSLSEFIDLNSNPSQQSSTYSISALDTNNCNIISNSPHTTIHLSSNQGVNGQVNLQWNTYSGISFNSFSIYRSNNGSAYSLIGNTNNSSYSYTDVTPPSGTNYYYVSIASPTSCVPSRAISSSISNTIDGMGNLINSINNITSNDITSVYPNPFNDFITTEPYKDFKLYDTYGRLVYSSNKSKDLTNLSDGFYFLKADNLFLKVIKKK